MVTTQVAAGAVVYDPKTKRFLLLKHRQGHWAFPQGKQEKNESISQTLSRELKEETYLGAKDAYGPVCEVTYDFSFRRKKIHKIVKFWAVLRQGDVRISSEHHGFLWATYKESKRLLKFTNHTNALNSAHKELKKQKQL
jgi:8-oxo-dGTP pyrophosphatase MutT (NUDIX family)